MNEQATAAGNTGRLPFQKEYRMTTLPEGLIIVCKRECATCTMLLPAMRQIARGCHPLTIYTQDDSAFPEGMGGVVDDTALQYSYALAIEAVPTLIQVQNGIQTARVVGWDRSAWRSVTGIADLGQDLPETRPGCGSKSVEPGIAEQLAVRYGGIHLAARRIETSALEDEIETCFARGWTDGLPVVPPTEVRVVRMLAGTRRAPDEVVAIIPPNQKPCTVEKVAINAVMAGCKPEYLPIVLAAVEAACLDSFCLHGLLATTYFPGPVVIVNGPIAKAVGMNSGINAFGQGNRANATIGRALQLVVRNVGGGRPGEIDRATLGTPGKYTFCFAEDEAGSPWESLAAERGFAREASTVTLFAGGGVQPIFDQLSREPESLARTYAACLRTLTHPKIPMATDAVLAVAPEHGRIFRQAGWSKADLREKLSQLLQLPGADLVRGAHGIAEGVPEALKDVTLPKFRPGGLEIVHVGGTAGLFSAIIAGWVASGPKGSQSVTKEIRS